MFIGLQSGTARVIPRTGLLAKLGNRTRRSLAGRTQWPLYQISGSPLQRWKKHLGDISELYQSGLYSRVTRWKPLINKGILQALKWLWKHEEKHELNSLNKNKNSELQVIQLANAIPKVKYRMPATCYAFASEWKGQGWMQPYLDRSLTKPAPECTQLHTGVKVHFSA